MGGCAPHISFLGIFKSSTKITTFPYLGPYIPRLILSNFESIVSIVIDSLVYALNPNSIGTENLVLSSSFYITFYI